MRELKGRIEIIDFRRKVVNDWSKAFTDATRVFLSEHEPSVAMQNLFVDALYEIDRLRIEIERLTSRVARLETAGDRMARVIVAHLTSPNWEGIKFECQVCENGFYDTESEIVHAPDCPVTEWQKTKEEK